MGDRLDVLVTLIEAWERTHFPMELPDAVEAIKFRMEQQGLTVKDLEPTRGDRVRGGGFTPRCGGGGNTEIGRASCRERV